MHNNFEEKEQARVFLPHESYVMSPGEYVEIDFPDVNEKQPTTCLTIEISQRRIEAVSERMRDLTTLASLDYNWRLIDLASLSMSISDRQ